MKFCIDLNNCQGTHQKCILQDRNFVASFQPQLQSNSDIRMNYRNDQFAYRTWNLHLLFTTGDFQFPIPADPYKRNTVIYIAKFNIFYIDKSWQLSQKSLHELTRVWRWTVQEIMKWQCGRNINPTKCYTWWLSSIFSSNTILTD